MRNAKHFSADKVNQLPHLKELDLSKMFLADEQLWQLKEKSSLELLDIRFSQRISKGALHHLTRVFKNLQTIFFHEIVTDYEKEADKLTVLGQLNELQKISLVYKPNRDCLSRRLQRLVLCENFA